MIDWFDRLQLWFLRSNTLLPLVVLCFFASGGASAFPFRLRLVRIVCLGVLVLLVDSITRMNLVS